MSAAPENQSPRVQHGLGAGLPLVRGECPMGCGRTLFLGSGGYVTCSWHACPDPCAASDMLGNPHLLAVTEDALRERNQRLDLIERLARGERVVLPASGSSSEPDALPSGGSGSEGEDA